ncbi:MAG: hypothetical protein E6G76_19580 [Alphaproteobacteria bacterium]|nr:MAG: hypothetical protein E6G76_19580 [Alphaproteobacteria bacterium]
MDPGRGSAIRGAASSRNESAARVGLDVVHRATSLRYHPLRETTHEGWQTHFHATQTLPILPALQRVIDGTPCGDLTFLVNDWGRPFTDAGFGNKFRDWCNQAGLRHCSAHGLRKAGATVAANNGATSRQLMAIFGWDTLKEAERYTRAADQKLLAEAAMHMLETPEQNGTESCPTKRPGGTFLGKS